MSDSAAIDMAKNSGIEAFADTDLKDPLAVLRKGLELFPGKISLASSFSMEDTVLIDMLASIDKKARIFALDTGRLPDETYQCAESIRAKYGVNIEWYFPKKESVEKLIGEKGLYSFRDSVENRHECCGIRKVEPLNRALNGLDAWITGQRKEQSVTRGELHAVEVDAGHGNILKLNPLAEWSFDDVKQYVKDKGIPRNKLYDQGYLSIGCAPCTRAVNEGEHERAGRWWWENPEHKECGLHFKN